MFESFLLVFKEMSGVLLLIAVGFALNRLNLIPKTAGQTLSRLVTLLFLPAIQMYVNLMECRVDSLAENAVLVAFGVATLFVSMGASVLLARRFAPQDDYARGIYRYAFTIPNTGAVGTPLVLGLFGMQGLFQYNLFLFTTVLMTYSWGVIQLRPKEDQQSLKQTLRGLLNPTFIALLLGIVLGVLGAKEWLPSVAIDTVEQLSNCYVPISLLMVGYTVADFPVARVLREKKAYLYSALRLLIIPCTFLVVMRLIHAPDIVCMMTVLTYACPCGMNVVVFPSSYGQDCSSGVSMVIVSSVLCLITAPIVYALACL